MSKNCFVPALMLCAILAGCQNRKAAPTLEELERQQFGGTGPSIPEETSFSLNRPTSWSIDKEWPKASAKLEMRFAFGTVSRRDRKCKIIGVSGDTPVADIAAGGTLITSEGEHVPVGWSWNEWRNLDEKESCTADPVNGRATLYHLVRSEPHSVWRLTLADRAHSRLDNDHVQSTCERIEAYLGNERNE